MTSIFEFAYATDISMYIDNLLFRLWRAVFTYERHTRALRVPVGDVGCPVVRTCRSAVLGPRGQSRGKRRHQRREDVFQSQWEATVSAQSQVSSTVSTVPRCTLRLWTATRPQRYPIRFVDTSLTVPIIMSVTTACRAGNQRTRVIGWPFYSLHAYFNEHFVVRVV